MKDMKKDTYQSPLSNRYPSYEMKHLFSDDVKFSTWRKLWIALAEAEKEQGLNITDEQIAELNQHVYDINYEEAQEREKLVRHDVMSHVYAYGQQCPNAKGIIHLGATSCYVTDNTDIINMREACLLIKQKLLATISLLAKFCEKYKCTPTLGCTHGQPAAPTTVGKRAAIWLQNFTQNYQDLNYLISNFKMLGCRGATGSQETFMELFNNDEEKADAIEKSIVAAFGFKDVYPISGQTYPRNLDVSVLNQLAEISVSAYKMAEDIRLLQHDKEIEEPFGKNQIGSSAMAYKRNPMRSERICSLSRYLQSQVSNAIHTADTQWFERTLDDSANRRMCIPESFLTCDAILIICSNVIDGLVVYPKVIEKRLNAELPFMITENIIMEAVKKGGNRQELHERIRVHSMAASNRIKNEGLDNNLIELIVNDPIFNMSIDEIKPLLDPSKLVGRCPQQVTSFLEKSINPILEADKSLLTSINKEVNV